MSRNAGFLLASPDSGNKVTRSETMLCWVTVVIICVAALVSWSVQFSLFLRNLSQFSVLVIHHDDDDTAPDISPYHPRPG